MRRAAFGIIFAGLTGLALSACGGLDAATANRLAVENLRENLAGQAGAVSFLEGSTLLDRADTGGTCAPDTPPDMCAPEPEPFDWDGAVDELLTRLEETVFVTGNVESQGGGTVTYLLRPAIVCAQETGEAKTACEDFLTKVELRLVASAPADGDLDLEVQVGSERIPAGTLRLHHDQLAIMVDLEETARAMNAIALALGEALPELPEVMRGQVELAFRKEADRIFEVRALVHSAVRIEQDGLELALSAASPVVSIRVDGVAETVTAALSFGPIDLVIPAERLLTGSETCTFDPETGEGTCVAEPPPLAGNFGAHLAGLTGSGTFTTATEVLQLTGLGLGNAAATVTYAGLPFLAVDVNAAAGRSFDLEIADVAGEGVDVTVTPSLDLAISLDLARARTEDPSLPAWADDEDLAIVLDQASRPAIRFFDSVPIEPGGLEPTSRRAARVQSGILVLDGTSLASPVVVDAGMCLFEDLTVEGEQHPFAVLSAGSCGP